MKRISIFLFVLMISGLIFIVKTTISTEGDIILRSSELDWGYCLSKVQ